MVKHAVAFLLVSALAPTGRAQTTLSPYLYGQNLWHAVNPGDGANQVWGRMKEAKFALVRVGGIEWNDRMPAASQWATWVDSIRAIGAEPLLQVSSKETPAAAAALVEQLNVKLKYAVRFWAIGNEPTCGQDAGAAAAAVAGIARNFKDRAAAMKAVDPTIKIVVGDECYFRGELYNALIGGPAAESDVTGKDPSGNYYADIVSFHSYPFPGADKNALFTRAQVVEGGAAGIRGMMKACKDRIATANTLHARAGAQALACALTEFNVTYWNSSDNTARGVGVRSFLNGQFVAEIFGSAMEYGFVTAAPWCMFEAAGNGGGSDLGMFDGAGPYNPRPYYHHIRMMSNHMGGRFVPSSDNLALVKTYATQDADRSAIIILNQSQDAGQAFTLKFGADAPVKTNPLVITLASGYAGELVDSIGPQESLLLQIHSTGKVLVRSVYSVKMAEQNAAPATVLTPLPNQVRDGRANSAARSSRMPGSLQVASGRLSGVFAAGGAFETLLRDLHGRRVARASGRGKAWSLSTGGLPAGVYLLSLRSGGETLELKVALGR